MKLNLISILICLFCSTAFGQVTYSNSITASGTQNYQVEITIIPTAIVPAQSSCSWGYNYDVAYDYNVQIIGGNNPSLYTLNGYITCGSNQGIYFSLPNSGGSGNAITQGNSWNSNSDCATATVESLMCDSITIQIEGPGIPLQTISLFSNYSSNDNPSDWDIHGNNADSTDFIGTINDCDLRIRSNNNERMRITRDGKIGIGIQNPTKGFEVNKTSLFSQQLFMTGLDTIQGHNEEQILYLSNDGQLKKGDLKSLTSALYKPVACLTDGNGNSPSPTWSNGLNKLYSNCPKVNVGIGTASPLLKLDVRGHAASRYLRVGNTPTLTNDNILIKGYGATGSRALLSIGEYQGAEEKRLELKSDGSLEIFHFEQNHAWTGNPISAFHENELIMELNSDGTLFSKAIEINHTGQEIPLVVRINGEEILQLENDGLLRSRKIRIDLENWADFVFEENYNLMPLSDLKTYISKNKHLPEIPSEEEIVEDGLDLAQMNKLLMKKIEELTLYLLEQNDKTEDLQKEIEELKQQLSTIK